MDGKRILRLSKDHLEHQQILLKDVLNDRILVQKSSTLVVEHNFYSWFQLKNVCVKKSACLTQKTYVKINFHKKTACRNGAFPHTVS